MIHSFIDFEVLNELDLPSFKFIVLEQKSGSAGIIFWENKFKGDGDEKNLERGL